MENLKRQIIGGPKKLHQKGVYILFFLMLSLAGCASADLKKLQDATEEIATETAIDVLLEIHDKYNSEKGIEYLDRVAREPLSPIKKVLDLIDQKAKNKNIPIETPVTLSTSDREKALQIISDAETRWINDAGWMRLSPKTPTDHGYDNENPLLFTAEYLWLVYRLGLLEGEFRESYKSKITSHLLAMQLQPGLFDRYPIVNRPADVRTFSMDEQLGIIVMSQIYGGEIPFAREQYQYGNAHAYLYLNAAWSAPNQFNRPIVRDGVVIPTIKEIPRAQRFGAFVEVIRRTASVPTLLASDVMICAGTLLSTKKSCDDVGDHLMNYMTISALKGQTSTLDGCFYLYKTIEGKRLTEGTECNHKEVTADNLYAAFADFYFQQKDHPIKRLAELLPKGAL